MKKIWEFFENMDELVYVSDMETYELVYMNKKALETYGFYSVEEITGKKCYEVMQNCFTPCVICNNQELTPGCFKEWWYYNPVLDKHLMVKDTMLEEDGKRYRMEIALDVGGMETLGGMLENCRNLETMINEGLRIALLEETPAQTLEVLLAYMGKALGAERTYIFEKNEKGGDDNTYEWAADGVTSEKENLQNVPQEVCAGWYRTFDVCRHIVIEDLEAIRESEPLLYENLKRQKVRSLVVIPLYAGGRVIGFFGVDNPPEKLLDYASNMLQIMAHFIVASLKRRNLFRELERMSYCDQLTKIGNRYAMEEYIGNIQQGQSVGVVYCDVTGLKRVNDSRGHKAGDKLIINACENLRQVFGGYGLFRIGGDELLAVCIQIEEDALAEKIEQLKRNLLENSVEMAIGAAWKKESPADIEKMMAEAEQRMYLDKAGYYQRNGIDRRT